MKEMIMDMWQRMDKADNILFGFGIFFLLFDIFLFNGILTIIKDVLFLMLIVALPTVFDIVVKELKERYFSKKEK